MVALVSSSSQTSRPYPAYALRSPRQSETAELDELWHDYMSGLLKHCPKLGADRDPKEPFRRGWRGEDLVIEVEGVPVGFIVIAGTTDDALIQWLTPG